MRDERFEVTVTRAARLHRQRARAAPPALLPDDIRVVLQLDGLAERERHRRQA